MEPERLKDKEDGGERHTKEADRFFSWTCKMVRGGGKVNHVAPRLERILIDYANFLSTAR